MTGTLGNTDRPPAVPLAGLAPASPSLSFLSQITRLGVSEFAFVTRGATGKGPIQRG